ncbi:MAG: hypothetical protein CR959_02440 [Fusobacteriales bacterium]|nr:MAG: hypothetical protein CR959_02440 [Fusobacteriales bacterium]
MKTIRIGTEENHITIKEAMSFYERKEHKYGFGGIVTTNRDASRLEFNTRVPFSETGDYFLLNSQVQTIVENGKIIYDYNDPKQRRGFSKILKDIESKETCKNLDEALEKIKEINELKVSKEEEEETKND